MVTMGVIMPKMILNMMRMRQVRLVKKKVRKKVRLRNSALCIVLNVSHHINISIRMISLTRSKHGPQPRFENI